MILDLVGVRVRGMFCNFGVKGRFSLFVGCSRFVNLMFWFCFVFV